MRTFVEAEKHARDQRPFSNGTEGYGWMAANCDICIHDKPAREDKPEEGCPLIVVALGDKTPSEWLDGPRDEHGRYGIADQYHCVEFRDEDDPGPQEPKPIPDPPGQESLVPREPFVGTRMLVQAVEAVHEGSLT